MYTYLYIFTFEVLTVLIDLFIVLCFVYASICLFICRFMHLPADQKTAAVFFAFVFQVLHNGLLGYILDTCKKL